jgi:hypothetical protein
MAEKLTPEEVAILIRARKILKARALAKDIDVKKICEQAGISRKTGYEWAAKFIKTDQQDDDEEARRELARLKAEHEQLKKRHDDLKFENEGRKLAWEIHGVDEWLRAKKNTTARRKKKKR